jgi:hypothetical protein
MILEEFPGIGVVGVRNRLALTIRVGRDPGAFPREVLECAVGISAAERPADEVLVSDSGVLRNLVCVLGRHAEGARLMRDLLRVGEGAAGIEAKPVELSKIAASA